MQPRFYPFAFIVLYVLYTLQCTVAKETETLEQTIEGLTKDLRKKFANGENNVYKLTYQIGPFEKMNHKIEAHGISNTKRFTIDCPSNYVISGIYHNNSYDAKIQGLSAVKCSSTLSPEFDHSQEKKDFLEAFGDEFPVKSVIFRNLTELYNLTRDNVDRKDLRNDYSRYNDIMKYTYVPQIESRYVDKYKIFDSWGEMFKTDDFDSSNLKLLDFIDNDNKNQFQKPKEYLNFNDDFEPDLVSNYKFSVLPPKEFVRQVKVWKAEQFDTYAQIAFITNLGKVVYFNNKGRDIKNCDTDADCETFPADDEIELRPTCALSAISGNCIDVPKKKCRGMTRMQFWFKCFDTARLDFNLMYKIKKSLSGSRFYFEELLRFKDQQANETKDEYNKSLHDQEDKYKKSLHEQEDKYKKSMHVQENRYKRLLHDQEESYKKSLSKQDKIVETTKKRIIYTALICSIGCLIIGLVIGKKVLNKCKTNRKNSLNLDMQEGSVNAHSFSTGSDSNSHIKGMQALKIAEKTVKAGRDSNDSGVLSRELFGNYHPDNTDKV